MEFGSLIDSLSTTFSTAFGAVAAVGAPAALGYEVTKATMSAATPERRKPNSLIARML